MHIQLTYSGKGAAFTGSTPDGHEIILDGSPSLGGENLGVRPMEMVLFGLAGCAAMDILHIVQKGRTTLTQAYITATGHRVDTIPSVFERIHLSFTLAGKGLTIKQARRAIDLSLERYCSVAQMLSPHVQITSELNFIGENESHTL